MPIDQEIIRRVKGSCDISEVIRTCLPLRKQGKNFTCNCPFHEEKTPSFVVNSEKQFCNCFGCGYSGDVYKFLMDFKGIDFPAAVYEVARFVGVHIDNQTSKPIKPFFTRQQKEELELQVWFVAIAASDRANNVRIHTRDLGKYIRCVKNLIRQHHRLMKAEELELCRKVVVVLTHFLESSFSPIKEAA
ncbi:DNA primase [Thalassocella blandensis]|nr:DNA primase [Thalassocella blandensis]